MDPWKPIRLWFCIGVIVAFLAVGTYARLRWGVPEAPYGYSDWVLTDYGERVERAPRRLDPFWELEARYHHAEFMAWRYKIERFFEAQSAAATRDHARIP